MTYNMYTYCMFMCNIELKKQQQKKTKNNLLKMTYRAITQMWDLEFVRVPL